MALPTGKAFKSIKLVNKTANAFSFTLNEPIEIKTKNDNLQSVITLKENIGVDFFTYRYITFDNETLFEIESVIKNGKYYTIQIAYLGELNLKGALTDTFSDDHFFISKQTPNLFQNLPITLDELNTLYGKSFYNIETKTQSVSTPTDDDSVMYWVKLRLSEIPQNLTTYLFDKNVQLTTERGNYLRSASRYDRTTIGEKYTYYTIADCKGFDNAVICYIPVPLGWDYMNCNYTYNGETKTGLQASKFSFLNCLQTLISDLCLSIEICLLDKNSIGYLWGRNYNMAFDTITYKKITQGGPSSATIYMNLTFDKYKDIDLSFARQVNDYPVLICDMGFRVDGGMYGFTENYNFVKITSYDINLEKQKIFSLFVLGQTIDMQSYLATTSQITTNLYVKRGARQAQIYFDHTLTNYQTIQTSFEFAKSAYSNYEAYKKANIDTQTQSQQMQNTGKLGTNIFQSLMSNIVDRVGILPNVLSNAFSGDYGNALSSGIQPSMNLFSDLMGNASSFISQRFTNKYENKINQYLEQNTIKTTSDITGSIDTATAFLPYASIGYFIYFDPVNTYLPIQKYLDDNIVLEKINVNNTVVIPEWTKQFQIMLETNTLNDKRKTLVLWVDET